MNDNSKHQSDDIAGDKQHGLSVQKTYPLPRHAPVGRSAKHGRQRRQSLESTQSTTQHEEQKTLKQAKCLAEAPIKSGRQRMANSQSQGSTTEANICQASTSFVYMDQETIEDDKRNEMLKREDKLHLVEDTGQQMHRNAAPADSIDIQEKRPCSAIDLTKTIEDAQPKEDPSSVKTSPSSEKSKHGKYERSNKGSRGQNRSRNSRLCGKAENNTDRELKEGKKNPIQTEISKAIPSNTEKAECSDKSKASSRESSNRRKDKRLRARDKQTNKLETRGAIHPNKIEHKQLDGNEEMVLENSKESTETHHRYTRSNSNKDNGTVFRRQTRAEKHRSNKSVRTDFEYSSPISPTRHEKAVPHNSPGKIGKPQALVNRQSKARDTLPPGTTAMAGDYCSGTMGSRSKVTSFYVLLSDSHSKKSVFVDFIRNRLNGNQFIHFEWKTECCDTRQRNQVLKLTFASKTKADRAMRTLMSVNFASSKMYCQWNMNGVAEKLLVEQNKQKHDTTRREIQDAIDAALSNHKQLIQRASDNYDNGKGKKSIAAQEVEVLERKLFELKEQEKEFLSRCQVLQRKFEKCLPSPEYSQKVKSIREEIGVECRRLKDALPIYAYRTRILETIAQHQVTIVLGETGSGKSTQLTQFIHEAQIAPNGAIVCTQPRKVAASTLATRVASELATSVGHLVGYKAGLHEKASRLTRIMYMTDHALLQQCLKDPLLKKYSCIILDEAHERSLYTDLLLGMIKSCLDERKDLKVIITSATINPEVFKTFFNNCPVVDVPGRLFPVDIMYGGTIEDSGAVENYEELAVDKAKEIHLSGKEGDVLVFLTSPLETAKSCERLRQRLGAREDYMCMELHGKSQRQEQENVFKPLPPGVRKIVFATNCAETSVTIPGIRFVVDTGMVKELQYDEKKNMNRLVVTKTNKSSAKQRAGRAGRTSAGVCHRLYSEQFYSGMEPTLTPELLRIHLGYAILKLMELGVDPLRFSFVESPPVSTLQAAKTSLIELGAVDENGLTELGSWLAKFPLDPKLSLLIRNALDQNLTMEGVVLAGLSGTGGSIFFRAGTVEEKNASDLKKTRFTRQEGDLVSMLAAYREWERQPERLKGQWCFENNVNGKAIKGVRETANEIVSILRRDLHIAVHQQATELTDTVIAQLQSLIFRSFAGNLCFYLGHAKAGYLCLRLGQRVFLQPGSSNVALNSPPEWLVFDQLTTTNKEYIGNATAIPEKLIPDVLHVGQESQTIHREALQTTRVALVFETELGSAAFRSIVGPRFSNLDILEQTLMNDWRSKQPKRSKGGEQSGCCEWVSEEGSCTGDQDGVANSNLLSTSVADVVADDAYVQPDTETPRTVDTTEDTAPVLKLDEREEQETDTETPLTVESTEDTTPVLKVDACEEQVPTVIQEPVVVIDADKDKGLVRVYSSQTYDSTLDETIIFNAAAVKCSELEADEITEALESCENRIQLAIGKGGLTRSVLHEGDFDEVTVFGTMDGLSEEGVESIMSEIGAIQRLEWIEKTLKDGRTLLCKIRFKEPTAASDAVLASEEDILEEVMSVKRTIPRVKTVVPHRTIRLSLTVLRRPTVGAVVADLQEDLYRRLIHIGRITLFDARVKLELGNRDGEFRLDLRRFKQFISPRAIEDALLKELSLEMNDGIFRIRVIREKVSEDSEKMMTTLHGDLRKLIGDRIGQLFRTDHFTIESKVSATNLHSVFYEADFAIRLNKLEPRGTDNDFRNLRDRQGRHVTVTSKTDFMTISVKRNVYQVCKDAIRDATRCDANSSIQAGTKAGANVTVTSREVEAEIKAIIEELVMDCEENIDLLHLTSMDGSTRLREIARSTSTNIFLDQKSRCIVVQGAPANKLEARAKVQQYLECVAKDCFLEISLKREDSPPGLMRSLLQDVGDNLQGIFAISGISMAHLHFRNQTLIIRGTEQAVADVSDLVERVSSKLRENTQICSSTSELACSVCLSDLQSMAFYRLEYCGHAYCKNCFKKQIVFAIDNTELPLSCCQCNKQWVWLDISNAILAGNCTLQNVLSASLRNYVNEHPNEVRPCLTADCPMVYKVTRDTQMFMCPMCQLEICSSCHTEYHWDSQCSSDDKGHQSGPIEGWLDEDTCNRKVCPNCGIGIEKSGGCNHVACKCKRHVCWVCLQTFSSSAWCYSHLRRKHGGIGLVDDGIGVGDLLLDEERAPDRNARFGARRPAPPARPATADHGQYHRPRSHNPSAASRRLSEIRKRIEPKIRQQIAMIKETSSAPDEESEEQIPDTSLQQEDATRSVDLPRSEPPHRSNNQTECQHREVAGKSGTPSLEADCRMRGANLGDVPWGTQSENAGFVKHSRPEYTATPYPRRRDDAEHNRTSGRARRGPNRTVEGDTFSNDPKWRAVNNQARSRPLGVHNRVSHSADMVIDEDAPSERGWRNTSRSPGPDRTYEPRRKTKLSTTSWSCEELGRDRSPGRRASRVRKNSFFKNRGVDEDAVVPAVPELDEATPPNSSRTKELGVGARPKEPRRFPKKDAWD